MSIEFGASCRSPRVWMRAARSPAGLIGFQTVRYFHVLAHESDPGRVGLHLQQRSEILAAMPAADQALNQLMHGGGHRQRDLPVARRRQPEIEVFTQKRCGEG